MRALVTGGTGFIGSHLINHLLNEKKAEVYALIRDLNNLGWLDGLDIHLLNGDLFSIPSLPKNIDYIFHIAGITKARKLADYYTVNQHGTASLFQFLHSQNLSPKKIILLSSTAAVGPSLDGIPVKEEDDPHPVTVYGQSKLFGEREALKFTKEFPLLILRAGAVYGPRDEDFMPYFKSVKRGFLLTQASQASRYHVCYIKDLIHSFDLSMQQNLKSGEIINIADPQHITMEEFGRVAGEILGKKLTTIRCPLFLVKIAALVRDGVASLANKPSTFNRDKLKAIMQISWFTDTKKAERLLSFSTRFSLKQGLEETLTWYIDHGWL